MNQIVNFFLAWLNNVGQWFWDYSIGMFVQVSLLIIVLLAVDFLLRKRVRTVFRYCLWMLVFVKLVLPPALCLPTGIGYWFGDILPTKQTVSEPMLNMPVAEPTTEPVTHQVSGISTKLSLTQPPRFLSETPAAAPAPATTAISTLPAVTWQTVVFLTWLTGVLVFSVLLIQRMLFVKGLIAQSEPATGRLLDMLNQCRWQVGIHRNIKLMLTGNTSSPAVCGLAKPIILMPTALCEKLSPEKLRAVLIHELAHIKRGDLWVNLAQTFLQIIYFYNPFVWLANAVVRRIREQAVDEMVLVVLGAEAKTYSNTLIDIAEMAFFRANLALSLIGVAESKKSLERRIRHMLTRPMPKSAKLGIAGLIAIIITASILLPMAKADDQSTDNTLTILDSDKDGLENQLEVELGTNPKKTDTDSDGLSDYDEYCKYRTDPTKKDSDGDSKPDGDWQERREYTYTIRAICEIRPPSSMELINDLYQDARPFEKNATLKDARVVEVLIFPFATAHIYSQPYPKKNLDKKLKEYIKPTVSMNYSPETEKEISDIIEGTATDVEAIEKMLRWINSETELVRELPHWEYFNIVDGKIAWHQSVGGSQRDQQFLETNFFGDSMFKKKVHGTCSSTAILRGTMFRAAGLPTRLIQTLPLITRYSEDPEPLADRLRMREMAKGYTWGPGNGGANHTYNEVFLNNRWVRVDNSIGTGPFVSDKLFVKAWSSASWNNLKEEWNDKRCFRALDVSDAYPKYKSESTRADIAIEDKNLTVTKQPDGRFRARVSIHNYGNTATPQFKVIFYAGDPSKEGRKVYPGHHNAGPIMPGGTWNEGTLPFTLNEDETEIFVIVDPDNMVEELDETNNKASQTISTTVKVKPDESTESTKVDIAIEDKDLVVTKLSDELFEAVIVLRNKGSVPIPRFSVYFYAGDRDKGGRLLSAQAAGPIMPGGTWAEYNPGLNLRPGETVISVVVDPGNEVEESDETNNKASQTLSKIVSESEEVDKVGSIQKVNLAGDDILQVEAQEAKGFNFPYYLFIPGGIDKNSPVYMLVESNNSGMVSDDLEFHRARALMLVKKSHANRMARRLGVPLLVPTFPRPRPETHWWAYTHALDIDTLEIEEGKLKRVDLQLTAMIKHAQEFLRTNGFKINDKVFMHGFSASAKFCNRYSYLHPEIVKAAAAGGVNGLPTLPVREWNGYELPFPIGIAGIERFTGKPFDERALKQVAHYIYMGSSDRNDTLLSREAWREEEADIIRKALAAEKMMPDRWELSRKIYRQQKLPAQLVTYNGVGHSIQSQMLDDVIDFFKANAGEKYVPIKPYEYPVVKSKESRPKDKTKLPKIDIAIGDKDLTVTKHSDGSFRAEIAIYNKGSYPLPQFGVNFYAGDPDKGGRLLASHAAGPIMPGDGWGEYNPRLKLRPGENTISVVVDPGNKVEESDETNNKASQTISTTVKVKPVESKVPAEMVGTWFFDNPAGDEEQMAIFPDGRVVVLYSNGHKDETQYDNGFIELAEYNGAKCKMIIQEDGTLVQYFNYAETERFAKMWKRIDTQPHTNLLRPLTGPDVQVEGEPRISRLLAGLQNEKYVHIREPIIQMVQEIGDKEPILFLTQQLESENRRRRCDAALALELLGDRRGVPAIIKELNDTSYRPTTRIRSDGREHQEGQIRQDHYYAALLLGILGDERAVPALIEATWDETIAYQAAISLGQIGDKRAIPALHHMVQKYAQKPFLRLWAGYSLGTLDTPEGVKIVVDTLNNRQQQWTIRRHAIEALSKLGDKGAVPHLIAALKDEHPNIRVSAARALGAIGDASALPALEEALKDNTETKVNAPTTVSKAAAEAIAQIKAGVRQKSAVQAEVEKH